MSATEKRDLSEDRQTGTSMEKTDSEPPQPTVKPEEVPRQDSKEDTEDAPKEAEDDSKYPTGLNLWLIVFALALTVFLVALDGTILATAIPTITSYFGSLNDVAWYSAGYLLTTCAFQLPFGRAYALLNTKWTFMFSVLMFLIGSVVCGAAPTSVALIIGRAIAGIGGSGVVGGAFVILARNIPLRKRSLFTGFIGAAFAIAAVLGPIIGGAFTTNVTWRWCFYINLPIGAVVLFIVFLCLPQSVGTSSDELKGKTWWQIILKFDPIGTLILLPSIICLLLALQWGGAQYSWSSGRVIATLVVFAVTFLTWLGIQWWMGDEATLPLSVAKQRTVAGSTLYTLCSSAAFTIVVYYLPIWFQSVKGDDAEESGIKNLALVISTTIISLVAGGATVAIGYYSPFLYLGTICIAVGSGLLYTLQPDSGPGPWIGYQILFGAGIGMSLEQCNIAIQAVLPDDKIAVGTALVVFTRSLGGAIAVPIAQNVFEKKLQATFGPNVSTTGAGATNVIGELEGSVGQDEAAIVQGLNDAITRTFLVALILACLTLPPCFLVEWKSVKKEKRDAEDKKESKGKKDLEKNKEQEEKEVVKETA